MRIVVKSAFGLLLRSQLGLLHPVVAGAVMLFPGRLCLHVHLRCLADRICYARHRACIWPCSCSSASQIACQMTFTALDRAKESILVAVTRKFIILLPLIYLMPHLFSANPTMAVYMAEPFADAIAVTFTVLLFARQFKKALQKI